MSAAAVLGDLRSAGVRVRLRPDRTVGLSKSATPALVAVARQHRDGLMRLLTSEMQNGVATADVPTEWVVGVTRLGQGPVPEGVVPSRWCLFRADAAWITYQHGADLHAAGWGALDLFGLHPRAPVTRSECMGLAWLLSSCVVGPITPDTVGIVMPAGHLLHMRRMGGHARREAVPGWTLARKERGQETRTGQPAD